MNGVILKLDFEKAYDKVKWSFLQQTLKMKGFPEKWCSWIESFVSKGSVGVKVNDDIGKFFQTKKGLRQGDPLSPLLFNLVADMLAVIIARAKQDGQISGLLPILWMTVFQFYNMQMILSSSWIIILVKPGT